MATYGKIFRTGVAAVLLLAGITTVAQGQVPGGSSFGGGHRRLLQIKGKVVCAGCSLEEVRKGQPGTHNLYQLTHRQGRAVMEVREVNSSARWDLAWPPRLAVRAQDGLFQQLTAEENLLKEVEITGLLSSTRILDMFSVTIG